MLGSPRSLLFKLRQVATASAVAGGSTDLVVGEALTVELETLGLAAVAWLVAHHTLNLASLTSDLQTSNLVP